jgi:hypothetical protein
VIDTNVELRSHDHKRLLLKDIVGQQGLIAVGVGRGGNVVFRCCIGSPISATALMIKV